MNGQNGNRGLPCEAMKIKIKPDSISSPRHVAFPLLGKVKVELELMETDGIIEKVTEATDWCTPMVPVLKPNVSIRICVDQQKLNQAVVKVDITQPR